MRNISTLICATFFALTSATLLHAESTDSNSTDTPYTQPSNVKGDFTDSVDKKFWTLTDEELAQKIRWAIRDDGRLSTLAKSTEVSVKNNNASLSGTVASIEEKNRISSLARQTQGIKSVSNNLTVSN